jgi:branched-chain amino acid transport system ATP-binding protein
MSDCLLEVKNIETYYGPIRAISGVSLKIEKGDIVSVLGANGAGKTTMLKTISGALDCTKGQIYFEGKEIQCQEPDRVASYGISHVPEGREVFPFLTVEENLKMGAYGRKNKLAVKQDFEAVYDYFPDLALKTKMMAAYLSGGQQQMLVIGRALMADPKLMLLDEPSLGLSPILVLKIAEIIKRINEEMNITVLLVEQNAQMALDIGNYGYVMEVGRIVMVGSCEDLKKSEDIQEFYLGQSGETDREEKRWKKRKTWR